jgi:rhodanese-related sulfurtransferase
MSKGFISQGIHHLSPHETLEACTEGAVLVDVREDYMNRHKMFDVPEVIYCPRSILEETYLGLPRDKMLVFADAAGIHSKESVIFLKTKGFENIANMAGGLGERERDNIPLVIDKTERLSGSCMCMLRKREKSKK